MDHDLEGLEDISEIQGKPQRRVFFIPLLLLVFVVVAVVTFASSQVFDVTNIEVSGNRYLSDKEIRLLVDISPGQNIFLAPISMISKSMQKVPRIADVSITRRLPNTLEVTVIEKKAVAYIAYAGYFIEVDGFGEAISVAELIQDYDIPIISGIDVTYVSIGDAIEPSEGVKNAAYISELLSSSGVSNLSEIVFKDVRDISLMTSDGIKILLGSLKGIESRVSLISPLLASTRERSQKPKRIDVRVESKPVFIY